MTVKCPKCDSENTDTAHFCSNCATSLQPSEDIPVQTKTIESPREELTTGSAFADRYQIIEELGRGGMGRVYKAQDTEIKEKIALKLIKPEISSDKKTIERFQNELKLARKISHRNVCRMHDLGKSEGNYFITMEYVDGENLKGMIRMMGQLSSGKAISIAKQVCEGLSEAHRIGVVHRDLKPSNIMIDKDGNAKIMDFGIARSLTGKGITGVGVMIGTPEYMSPEQVESKEIDQRSDIYSLGVILYEMVTGQVPFEGDTPYSIGVKHKSEVPRNPKDINPQISDDLNRMILKCLEKEKEKRYQSAGELRSELENVERGMPTTDRVIPERKPLTSKEITVTFGLKKLLMPALVIIAIVIIGVIIWQLLPKKKLVPVPSDKASLAVMYFKNNTGDTALDHWRTMLPNLLVADLAQSKYIRLLSEDKLYNILNQLNQLDAETYTSEVLKQVATQGGVNHILQGTYAKAGDEIRINVMLQEANTGELIGSESVAGTGEKSIFFMIDELTTKIKANLKLTLEEITSDIDKEIGKITTSYPEAYRLYSEAFKFNWKGEYYRCIQLLERAVEIDPEFAIAYSMMATAYNNLGYSSKVKEYHQKVLGLSARMSEKEFYEAQGFYYEESSEKSYDKALAAFNKLVELYPDYMIGYRGLGYVYANLEEWDKTIECFEVNIRNNVEVAFPYCHTARAYRAKGLYGKAMEILDYYIDSFQEVALIRQEIAQNYICQGMYDLALTEADKAFILAPSESLNLGLKGDIYHCKADFVEAEREFIKLFEAEEQMAHLRGQYALGDLYLSMGRFEKSLGHFRQGVEQSEKLGEEAWKSGFHWNLAYVYLKTSQPEESIKKLTMARRSAEQAESISGQITALHLKGLAQLEMKLLDEAQRTADELKEQIDTWLNRKLVRHYWHLMGMIEQNRDNLSKAIEYFEKAISFLDYQRQVYSDNHSLFYDSLAFALYKKRDLEKAQEQYNLITKLTTGKIIFGDIYAKSFYMLGKIYEEQSDTAKAIEHYEKFLDLWKDADPGIAEVDDARDRLAGLKN